MIARVYDRIVAGVDGVHMRPQRLVWGQSQYYCQPLSYVLTCKSCTATIRWLYVYPGVELRVLRYVIAVAEELHFSRAALRVHVAQPSLSKQIRELECDLGVKLFDRTNRHVQLTHAGRIFVKEATKALAHAERAVLLARATNSVETDSILVGYTPRMNPGLLSIVRNRSLSHKPQLNLTFVSSHTLDQVQALLQGTIHAGLVTLPVRNESLVVKSLVREPLAVVVPESHSLASKRELRTTELRDLPVILRARRLHPASYDHLHKLFRRVGYSPNVVQEVTTEAEALYMVAEGMGIAFMKISAIPPDQGFAYAQISDISLFEETGFVYRRDNRSNKLKEFVKFLRSHSRELVAHCQSQDGDGAAHAYSDRRQLELF